MKKWKETANNQFKAGYWRLPAANWRQPTANLPQTLFCRQPGTADCQLATADFALPSALCALQNRRMES